jgi:hypothetical protein
MNHRGITYKIHFGLFFILLIFANLSVFAQVSVNTNGNAPHSSAMLDISSVNSGLLIPRMSQAQRTAILSPAEGLLVYQTDIPAGLYQFRAGAWERYLPHTGTISAGQLIFGNNNNGLGQDNLLFWNNTDKRLGIGTNGPLSTLSVTNTNFPASWIAADFGNATGSRLLLGNLSGNPSIGAASSLLTTWDTLAINPGGRVSLPFYAGSSNRLISVQSGGVISTPVVGNGVTFQNDSLLLGGTLSKNSDIFLDGKSLTLKGGTTTALLTVNSNHSTSIFDQFHSNIMVAQSFVTQTNGIISQISILTGSTSGGFTGYYELFEGNGFSGPILATANVFIPPFNVNTYVDIPLNVPVSAGQMYTIRVNTVGGNSIRSVAADNNITGNFYFDVSTIFSKDLTLRVYESEPVYNLFKVDGPSKTVTIDGASSSIRVASLSGTGTRGVVVSANGTLGASANPIPTVTSVTGSSPIQVTNSTTTPVISLPQATASVAGYLAPGDFNTFNNKQNALPNASSIDSGILTSTDWNTFNNKQSASSFAGSGTNGVLSSSDWNTFNNKQNALPNASASASGILTSTDWTTFNNKQNALPNASASSSGILTSTDWTTFNNKQNALPTFANGSVIFSNGTSLTQSSGQFHFDATNNRLGIGTNTPGKQLHIDGSNGLRVFTDNPGSGFQNWVAGEFGGNVGNKVVIGLNDGVATIGGHSQNLDAWAHFAINPGGGNVGIGNNNPLAKLDVTGSTNFDGPSTINGNISHTGNTTHTGNVNVTGSLTVTAATSLSATTVNGNLSTTGDLTTNVINATTVKQGVISSPITLSPTSTGHVVLLHNRGYNPVIMCSLEQSAGGFLEYVSLSYEHINNNEVKINFRNSAPFVASGTVHIIIVN